jgi:hypothetical protein
MKTMNMKINIEIEDSSNLTDPSFFYIQDFRFPVSPGTMEIIWELITKDLAYQFNKNAPKEVLK